MDRNSAATNVYWQFASAPLSRRNDRPRIATWLRASTDTKAGRKKENKHNLGEKLTLPKSLMKRLLFTHSVPKYKNIFNTSIVSKTFLYSGTEGVLYYYSWSWNQPPTFCHKKKRTVCEILIGSLWMPVMQTVSTGSNHEHHGEVT